MTLPYIVEFWDKKHGCWKFYRRHENAEDAREALLTLRRAGWTARMIQVVVDAINGGG